MKTIKLLTILISAVLLTQSCRKGSIWGIYGKGSSVNQTRSLSNFNSVNMQCDCNINYTQDTVYKVEVLAQENIQSILETKVVDGELRMSFLREVRSHDDIIVKIHSPGLNSININGSGNFTAQNTIQVDNIGLYILGSGNITIPTLNSNNIDSKIEGSGNITLSSGTGKTESYQLTGSGNVYASGMMCNTGIIKISGSGNISIYATNSLDITMSGSGDVRYKGTPTINTNTSGTGRLIHIN